MKMKKYVKPELFYEQFELSQHIADCAWELASADPKNCHAEADPDYPAISFLPNLFMSDTPSSCVLNENTYHDFCYHGSVSAFNTFKS